jgi:hypothetical protein
MLKSFLYSIVLILVFSCKTKSNGPDVSNIKLDVKIDRFEKAFFDTATPIPQKMELLYKNYGKLFDYYLFNTGISNGLATGLKPEVIVDSYIKETKAIYDSTIAKYKNLNELESEFKKAFQYYKHYFPQSKTPKVFSLIEPFYKDDQSTVKGVEFYNDTILVYLQMYLGKNFSLYDPQTFPDYIRERFNEKFIVRNSLEAIIDAKITTRINDAPLVEQMIAQGKKIYILNQLQPNIPEHINLNYTAMQLKDCIKNEKMIWTFLIDNSYLFSTDPQNIRDFNKEAPFTNELGNDSPGNIGAFVGLQIVKSYMQKNEKLSLQELLNTNEKIIYQQAKYKP